MHSPGTSLVATVRFYFAGEALSRLGPDGSPVVLGHPAFPPAVEPPATLLFAPDWGAPHEPFRPPLLFVPLLFVFDMFSSISS